MFKKKGRATRSDKKRDVKPFVTVELKDAIYRLSYITETPVKDVCEELCIFSLNQNYIIEEFSQYFVRKIRIKNTIYFGDLDNPRIHTKKLGGRTERISLRLKPETYEFIYTLSYALNCSVSRVVAILLEKGMHDITFINDYINTHLSSIDEKRKKELQKILDYINNDSDEEITIGSLLSYIVDEFKEPMKTTKEAVSDFIKHWKRK